MGGAPTGPQSIQDFTVTRRRVASASHLQHTHTDRKVSVVVVVMCTEFHTRSLTS